MPALQLGCSAINLGEISRFALGKCRERFRASSLRIRSPDCCPSTAKRWTVTREVASGVKEYDDFRIYDQCNPILVHVAEV